MSNFSNYKKFKNVGIRSSNDTLIVMDSSNNNISLHSSDGGDDNVDTVSIKNIINKKQNEDLNLSSLNGTTINPVITINNNHSDCRIMTNLNVSGNLNISEKLHITTPINSTVSTGTPPFSVNSTTTVPNLRAATAVVADSAKNVAVSALSSTPPGPLENWANNGTSLETTITLPYQEQKFPSGLIMRFGKIGDQNNGYTINFGSGMNYIYNIQVQGYRYTHNYQAINVKLQSNSSFKIYWDSYLDGAYWMVIGKA